MAIPLLVKVKVVRGVARAAMFTREAVLDVMAKELLLPVVVVRLLLSVTLPDPALKL